jgi:hypothetical protein
MYTRIEGDKRDQVVAWADEMVRHIKTLWPETGISTRVSIFSIHWTAQFDEWSSIQDWQAQLYADPGYQELYERGADLFISSFSSGFNRAIDFMAPPAEGGGGQSSRRSPFVLYLLAILSLVVCNSLCCVLMYQLQHTGVAIVLVSFALIGGCGLLLLVIVWFLAEGLSACPSCGRRFSKFRADTQVRRAKIPILGDDTYTSHWRCFECGVDRGIY